MVPILGDIARKMGRIYSLEIENGVFSKSQREACSFLAERLGPEESTDSILKLYLETRLEHPRANQVEHVDGLQCFLERLTEQDLRLISYGGAPFEHFLENIGSAAHFLSEPGHFPTTHVRSGMISMMKEFKLSRSDAIFFDTEHNVVSHGREERISVAGLHNGHELSPQYDAMKADRTPFLFESLHSINNNELSKIVRRTSNDTFWDA
jgi:hypothetical protein